MNKYIERRIKDLESINLEIKGIAQEINNEELNGICLDIEANLIEIKLKLEKNEK